MLRAAQIPLLATLLDYLRNRPDIRLLGPARAQERMSTVSFVTRDLEPIEHAGWLAERGIMAVAGNFYAVRLLSGMGVYSRRGAVRVSFVHCTTAEELVKLIAARDHAVVS